MHSPPETPTAAEPQVAPPEGGSATSSRDKILDTAEALFAQMGFTGVGLREVAQRVGLGKSSLFHHFPTKVHMYVAVLERVFLVIERRLEPALGGDATAMERLERWTDEFIDAMAESPTHAPLLLRSLFEADVVGDEDRVALDAILERILGAISHLIDAGVRAGELRQVSTPHLLQTLIGMTLFHFASGGFGDDLLDEPVYSATEVRRRKEEVRALLRRGLSPSPFCQGS